MRYRPHRGSLADSMAELVELPDRAALIAHLKPGFADWGFALTDDDIEVEPYGLGPDDRIGWDKTYIVTVRNMIHEDGRRYFGTDMPDDYFGAIGYTDGPV